MKICALCQGKHVFSWSDNAAARVAQASQDATEIQKWTDYGFVFDDSLTATLRHCERMHPAPVAGSKEERTHE